MLKEIYSFIVEDTKQVEEKTKEKRKNDAGVEEEVEVIKKVNKKIPYKIVIKEPTRRDLEEADMEFSIEMSNCIKKGILTKAMLAKKYSDTGGLLAESDANKLVDLYSDLADAEAEYTRRTLQNKNVARLPKKSKQEIDKLAAKTAIIRRDIVNLESSYQSLFNHTADTKAQNKIVMWYVTHLSYYKLDKEMDAELKPLFEGETFEGKIDSYYNKDEKQDSLFQLTSGKLAALISYWYFSTEVKKENFDKIINDIDNPS